MVYYLISQKLRLGILVFNASAHRHCCHRCRLTRIEMIWMASEHMQICLYNNYYKTLVDVFVFVMFSVDVDIVDVVYNKHLLCCVDLFYACAVLCRVRVPFIHCRFVYVTILRTHAFYMSIVCIKTKQNKKHKNKTKMKKKKLRETIKVHIFELSFLSMYERALHECAFVSVYGRALGNFMLHHSHTEQQQQQIYIQRNNNKNQQRN